MEFTEKNRMENADNDDENSKFMRWNNILYDCTNLSTNNATSLIRGGAGRLKSKAPRYTCKETAHVIYDKLHTRTSLHDTSHLQIHRLAKGRQWFQLSGHRLALSIFPDEVQQYTTEFQHHYGSEYSNVFMQ